MKNFEKEKKSSLILSFIVISSILLICLTISLTDNSIGRYVRVKFIIYVSRMNKGAIKSSFSKLIKNNIPGIFMKPAYVAYKKEWNVNYTSVSYIGDLIDPDKHNGKEYIETLIQLTNHKDSFIRSLAVLHLSMKKVPEAYEIACKLANEDNDPIVRIHALTGFEYIEDIRAVDFLVKAMLNRKEKAERAVAATALWRTLRPLYESNREMSIKKKTALKIQDSVILSLKDDSMTVKEFSLSILACYGNRAALEHIIPLLKDKDKYIVEQAAQAIRKIEKRYPSPSSNCSESSNKSK